ncbi:MAG: DUF2318 domain-containing protein [Firmicutes bacterium]|nr:DUF2318 domain-containing protein [Bacillota bacterium]MCL5039911.1 DUF2318 domain-containing protein [Bacillota bacterium]
MSEEKSPRKEKYRQEAGHLSKREKYQRVSTQPSATSGMRKSGTFSWPASSRILVTALIIVAFFAGYALWAGMRRVNYGSDILEMTPVTARVSAGILSLPTQVVKEKKLVSFDYKKGNQTVPLLAYLSPSGRLVTAVRLCEPCESTTFFINKNNLVCGVCGTTWSLETLKGITGGCISYPPAKLASREEGEQLIIDEPTILAWRPRK